MGVCDYTCAIQNNGQDLDIYQKLETEEIPEDSEDHTSSDSGCDEAILIEVPIGTNFNSMTFADLAQFPIRKGQGYSWDSWDFESPQGYYKVLFDEVAPVDTKSKMPEKAVWQSPDVPNVWLINVEPFAYACFVKQTVHHEQIPYAYYKLILENWGQEVGSIDGQDKQSLFDRVQNMMKM